MGATVHDIGEQIQAGKYRIGVIFIATELTAERHLHQMITNSNQTLLLSTRVQHTDPLTTENLRKMAQQLPKAVATILPNDYKLDVVCFACTSATAAIGEDRVHELLQSARPGVLVSNPLIAIIQAVQHLNLHKVELLAAYSPELTAKVATEFGQRGLTFHSEHCFGQELDEDVAQISEEAIFRAGVAAASDDGDALVISCTGLRSVPVVERLEKAIGRPVITSTTALLWHALHLGGQDTSQVKGYGQLFDKK